VMGFLLVVLLFVGTSVAGDGTSPGRECWPAPLL